MFVRKAEDRTLSFSLYSLKGVTWDLEQSMDRQVYELSILEVLFGYNG